MTGGVSPPIPAPTPQPESDFYFEKWREEPEGARQNRGAAIGLFVFSKRTAPAEMESFNRYGNDIIVVWDAEDAASDVFYTAGMFVAKALCSRPKSHSNETGADFEAVMAAILETERQAKGRRKSPSPPKPSKAAATESLTAPAS